MYIVRSRWKAWTSEEKAQNMHATYRTALSIVHNQTQTKHSKRTLQNLAKISPTHSPKCLHSFPYAKTMQIGIPLQITQSCPVNPMGGVAYSNDVPSPFSSPLSTPLALSAGHSSTLEEMHSSNMHHPSTAYPRPFRRECSLGSHPVRQTHRPFLRLYPRDPLDHDNRCRVHETHRGVLPERGRRGHGDVAGYDGDDVNL